MERNRRWVSIREAIAAIKKLPQDTPISQDDFNDMLTKIAEVKKEAHRNEQTTRKRTNDIPKFTA
jgi:hypothetical protein